MRYLQIVWLAVVLCFANSVWSQSIIISTPLTIEETNMAYEGSSLIISNTTVTINGVHGFSDITLINNAKITHSSATTGLVFKLDLTVSNSLIVATNCAIDVSGNGYLAGRTISNRVSGAAQSSAGGSYGGVGGYWGVNTPNTVYGDFRNPNELGSGGGNGNAGGGGLIRLRVRELVVDGTISANGVNGGTYASGGSGGGILIEVGRISGSGIISANGGSGYGGYAAGGGGGRIAIFYDEVSGFGLTNQVTTKGGASGSPGSSAGTVYLKSTNTMGCLYVQSYGQGSTGITPLWIPEGTNYTENIVLAGAGQYVTLDSSAIIPSNLIIRSGVVLTHLPTTTNRECRLELNVDTLRIESGGTVDVSGKGYLAGRTISNRVSGAAQSSAGGSYGGVGGYWGVNTPNTVYGDFRNPNELGSGGGNGNASGGGLIRLKARDLLVDGTISANGVNGGSGAAGGSGGGIFIEVGRISGSGIISANGGNGSPGYAAGGGGGRIAINYEDASGYGLTNQVTTKGGTSGSPGSSSGTVYLKTTNSLGCLYVQSYGQSSSGITPLWMPEGTSYTENLVLAGSGQYVALDSPAIIPSNLTIRAGAVLTHLATTTNREYRLELNADSLSIENGAAIDVSGKGYLAGRTAGNQSNGSAQGAAGGSYGGIGGYWGASTPNVVYGDYRNPNDLGSGAGNGSASGGGLIRIKTRALVVNGVILANGVNASGGTSGSSGGGIFIEVDQLSGTGSITANGGSGYPGLTAGGGGGRIAIYSGDLLGYNTNLVTALAGAYGNPLPGAGTIYIPAPPPSCMAFGLSILGITNIPFSSFTVELAPSILPGSFDVDDVAVSFNARPVTVSSVERLSDSQYRVSLGESLVSDGVVDVAIGPNIISRFGSAMDQNQNGIPGETSGDVFHGSIRLDFTPPTLTLQVPPPAAVNVPVTLSLLRYADSNGISKVEWNYGDGCLQSGGPLMWHTYTNAGQYTISAALIDSAGNRASDSAGITVASASRVVTVPWKLIGETELPHPSWSGRTNIFKAVAASAPLPFTYRWDFGDGIQSALSVVSNRTQSYALQASHAYTGPVDSVYTATVTIAWSNGLSASDAYPVKLSEKSTAIEIDAAVDDGLWYVHRTQERYALPDGTPAGYWQFGVYRMSISAAAVHAFKLHGHLDAGDALRDPYVETVLRGMDYMLASLSKIAIGPQLAGNPDSNGNGYGLTVSSDRQIYELGQVIDAMCVTSRRDTIAAVGSQGVIGRSYEDIVRDMVDTYAWGQSDAMPTAGGWRYSWQEAPDNSASQWGAIGLYAAEHVFGIQPPAWVKTLNYSWVRYSQAGQGFGYTSPSVANYANCGTTPSALIQLAWDGVTRSNAFWVAGESYIASSWPQMLAYNDIYQMYAIAKAMRIAKPLPITTFATNNFNWFENPSNGLARVLLKRQNSLDGSWNSAGNVNQPQYATPWALIILSANLFTIPPVARIACEPAAPLAREPVSFDGRLSYHPDPNARIVEYRWDFDAANGVNFDMPDATDPVVSHAYPVYGVYTAALMVVDDNVPALSNITKMVVTVSVPAHPPVAQPGGPYVAATFEDVRLNGSGSFDPDLADGDLVQLWEWFPGAVTSSVPVVSGVQTVLKGGFAVAGSTNVSLRVTDSTALIYPGLTNLQGSASAPVVVYERLITDLAARPKQNKCQLTWSPVGDEVAVMRSETGPNTGFVEIGRTRSTYATWLDETIATGKRYFYRIVVYKNGNPSPVGSSIAVYVWSTALGQNREPRITSSPLLIASAGKPYQCTVTATDPEGDPVSFSLLDAPEGMSINAQGVLSWLPLERQLGSYEITIVAADPTGADAQSYQLIVLPGGNSSPTAVANGPYEVLAGQSLSFSSAGSSDADGQTLSFLWNFGDGETTTGAAPSHVYARYGDYIARVFVSDGHGGLASDKAAVSVKRPNVPPSLVLAATALTVRQGQPAILDASGSTDSDHDVLAFTWTWGDGAVDVESTGKASHIYPVMGVYPGTVTVNDGFGGVLQSGFNITVGPSNTPPQAAFSIVGTLMNVGDVLTFDASTSSDSDGDPLFYAWSFDDGRTAEGAVAMHFFTTRGNHTATLTVRDNFGAVASCSRTIEIINAHPSVISAPRLAAAAGAPYAYSVVAQDPENDPLTFALDSAPTGMVIDAATGLVSWTPAINQVGAADVIIRVSDNSGAMGSQAFSILVNAFNRPPVANAGPDQTVVKGPAVRFDGRASFDPDNSPLTYFWSLVRQPAGVVAELLNNRTATPTLIDVTAVGTYAVSLVVNDGSSSSPADEVLIKVASTLDEPPVISSKPGFTAMVGTPYLYRVAYLDPEADAVTVSLAASPAGAVLSGDWVSWTPSGPGQAAFSLVAVDARGASSVQNWTVNVVQYTNLPPVVTSTPLGQTSPGADYLYTVTAMDPNLDTLTFDLVSMPAGMTVDASSGVIQWLPTQAQIGIHNVAVRVADGHGGVATQSFQLAVLVSGSGSPVIRPLPAQVVSDPQAFEPIRLDDYVTDPDHAPAALQWQVFGNSALSVSIDSARVAHLSYAPGSRCVEQITFVATDPAGLAGSATATFAVKGEDRAPVAAFANLSPDTVTSVRDGLFEFKGQADDPDASDAVSYRLRLFDAEGRQVANVTPAPLDAEGRHNGRIAAGGSLGTLDFTRLRNELYELVLDVKSGGQTTTTSAQLALDSALKVGQFTFSQRDISIPVRGLPLAVIRTYDSLNPRAGDFGFGWSFAIAEPDVRINETRGPEVDMYTLRTVKVRTGGSRDVTLTMPDDGRRITFRYELKQGWGVGMGDMQWITYTARWIAPPGVYASLEPTCDPTMTQLQGGGQDPIKYWNAAGLLPSPENFDFPGYILTTKDGTRYHIARESLGEVYLSSTALKPYVGGTIADVTTPTGDRIEFVRKAKGLERVDYFDSNGVKGRSLHFTRDTQNRIVAVYDPSQVDAQGQPQGLPAVKYGYDAASNLVSVSTLVEASDSFAPVYRTVSYEYGHSQFPHYITGIKDPRGIAPLRAEYDDAGRIVATVDANGNRVELKHDLAARTETVYDRSGSATLHVYDARGNVIASTDPLGSSILRTYDDLGNETSVTDPLGHTTRKTFDAQGNVLSVTDALGHTTVSTFDGRGNQTSVRDPLGNVTSNIFNSAGNLLATIDSQGHRSENIYDAQGGLVRLKDSQGRTTMSLGYDLAGQLSSMTDASGLPRSFQYDAKGNQTGTSMTWVNPANSNDTRIVTTQTRYDSSGLVTNTVDPLGNETWTRYNAIGKPEAKSDRLGNVTTFVYDSLGNTIQTKQPALSLSNGANGLTSETVFDLEGRAVLGVEPHEAGQSANGSRTTYDSAGRVVRTEALRDVVIGLSTQVMGTVTQITSRALAIGGIVSSNATLYDAAGRVVERIDEGGARTRLEYDAAGRNTAVVDANGKRTEFEYDAAGRQVLTRDALGRETKFVHDALGRQTATLFPDGTSVSNEFDVSGNRIAERDQAGKRKEFGYDELGRLVSVTMPAVADPARQYLPSKPVYRYTYSPQGTLLAIKDPQGRETKFDYDFLNRQTGRTLPLGQRESVSFDGVGRPSRKVDFKGQATETIYDSLGRVSGMRYFAAGTTNVCEWEQLGFDAQSRVTNVTRYAASGGTAVVLRVESRFYNDQGQLAEERTPEGILRYEYDQATGRKVRTFSDSGTDTRYGWDAQGRLDSVTSIEAEGGLLEPVTNVTRYTYTDVGSRSTVTIANGVQTRYSYNALNRLTDLIHVNGAGQTIGSYAYTLAQDGRRTSATELLNSGAGTWSNRVSYTYDELNRLTRESSESGSGAYEGEYEYDLSGNRVKRQVWSGGKVLETAYTYNANDQLVREVHTEQLVALPVGGTMNFRPLPGVWSKIGFWSVPVAMVLAFMIPLLLARNRLWVAPRLHPLWSGVTWALVVTAVVAGLPFEVLAQESALYAQVEASDWGKAGTVTQYEYDSNGSLVRKVVTGTQSQVEIYRYNLQNRMTGMTRTETRDGAVTETTTQYAYNTAGIRVSASESVKVDGVVSTEIAKTFLIDADNPTGYAQVLEEQQTRANPTTVRYVIGDDVISQSLTNNEQPITNNYLLPDGHGSTRQLTDSAGAVTGMYSYDSYGHMLGTQTGLQAKQKTSMLYSGEQFDSTLQQYYLRARYYNQANGQFTSLDPYRGNLYDPQSLHKYAYCHDEPVNASDPSGMIALMELQISSLIQAFLVTTLVSYSIGKLMSATYCELSDGNLDRFQWFEATDLLALVPGAILANVVKLPVQMVTKVGGEVVGKAFASGGVARVVQDFSRWFSSSSGKLMMRSANGAIIELEKGTTRKGFQHLLERHLTAFWNGSKKDVTTFWPSDISPGQMLNLLREAAGKYVVGGMSAQSIQLSNGIVAKLVVHGGKVTTFFPEVGPGVVKAAELLRGML